MLSFTDLAPEAEQVILSKDVYQNYLETSFSFTAIYKNSGRHALSVI